MNLARWTCLLAPLLAGCASAPTHYYTLVPQSERGPASAGTARIRLDVQPVRIPAQVDRLEIVSRLSDGGMTMAENERWIAPDADELRHALAARLLQRLEAPSSDGRGASESLTVRLNVERFESSLSRYVLIEGSWRLEVREGAEDVRIQCRTRAYEPVSRGYAELTRGYQRAVTAIADEIASVAQQASGGAAAQCPDSWGPPK